jgi:hypothetical protein
MVNMRGLVVWWSTKLGKYCAKGKYLCTACVESRFTGSLMFPRQPCFALSVSVAPKELSSVHSGSRRLANPLECRRN